VYETNVQSKEKKLCPTIHFIGETLFSVSFKAVAIFLWIVLLPGLMFAGLTAALTGWFFKKFKMFANRNRFQALLGVQPGRIRVFELFAKLSFIRL